VSRRIVRHVERCWRSKTNDWRAITSPGVG
jgi:hypothetical protein